MVSRRQDYQKVKDGANTKLHNFPKRFKDKSEIVHGMDKAYLGNRQSYFTITSLGKMSCWTWLACYRTQPKDPTRAARSPKRRTKTVNCTISQKGPKKRKQNRGRRGSAQNGESRHTKQQRLLHQFLFGKDVQPGVHSFQTHGKFDLVLQRMAMAA